MFYPEIQIYDEAIEFLWKEGSFKKSQTSIKGHNLE